MDDIVDIARPFVIGYNFIIMILFLLHLCMSMTKLPFIQVMAAFYIVDYALIIVIELFVYVIRGLLAFIGALKRHFWLMVLAALLTAMAVAYEIIMAKTFLTSERYYGYKPDLIDTFMTKVETYFKIEELWHCCGILHPSDVPKEILALDPSCCPEKKKDCVVELAYPVGCWIMQKYMVVAGVAVIILAVLDFLSFVALLLLARAAKNEDEDED